MTDPPNHGAVGFPGADSTSFGEAESPSANWTVDPQALDDFIRGLHGSSSRAWFELRRAAEHLALLPGFSELIALDANTIEELPHQTDVALRVLRHMGGRAILADEVGLGKTIEAGIILKELSVRGLARRVLIITPASLVSQWQDELETKFFEKFTAPEHPGDWAGSDRVIASFGRARHPRHRDGVVGRPWDLVIVDEAHKAKNHKSATYKLLQSLRRDYLLLLTATPLQNDLRELHNLVTLLRPGQFGSWKEFKSRYLQSRARIPKDPSKIRELASEVMVRTRRANVDLNLPPRHPSHPYIELTPQERLLYDQTTKFLRELYKRGFHEVRESEWAEDQRRRQRKGTRGLLALELIRFGQRLCSSTRALAESLATKARSEALLPEFRRAAHHLADAAREVPDNGKLMALDSELTEFPERLIVFSEHLRTVDLIMARVSQHGRQAIRFDGSLSKHQRAEQLRRFRAEKRSVLVSTRSGTEGLNLQFANVIVNYELPWNPMLIEQRIGRIHRIGQKREVYIRNFAAQDTVEAHVLEVLDEKIRLFELVVGELDVILGKFGDAGSLEKRFGTAWLEAGNEDDFEQKLKRIGAEIQESREEGLQQERRSSAIAPADPGDLLESEFAHLTIPARIRLGYGTRHLKQAPGVEARREALGLHVHEIQRALEDGSAVVEDAGSSEYGPSVRITGVTLRGRAVYLRVAADRLPLVILTLDADPAAPLVPTTRAAP